MKKVLIAVLCTVGFYSAAQAETCNLRSCAPTINADSGVTGRACNREYAGQECEAGRKKNIDYCFWTLTTSSNCPSGYEDTWDYHIDGRKYCVKYTGCTLPAPEAREEVSAVHNAAEQYQLEAVFGSSRGQYYGWANGNIRSPAAGRQTNENAKLDVCLGYNDVDGLSGATACHNACNNSNLNEHCTAYWTNNGSSQERGVCHDRCECIYGDAACDGL